MILPASGVRWRHLSFGCLVVAVIVQNCLLVRQNHALRGLVNPPPPPIEVGMRVDEISGVSMTGTPRLVHAPADPSEKLLLITMSPGCPICRANLADWVSLTEEATGRAGWRVLWVSRDPVKRTRQFFEAQNIRVADVVADPAYSTYRELKLEGVPYTFIVGSTGVERVWRGRITVQAVSDMRGLLRASGSFASPKTDAPVTRSKATHAESDMNLHGGA